MKRILYLTVLPNPFQLEFTKELQTKLVNKAELKVVFEKKQVDFRSHWGTHQNGIVLNKKPLREFRKLLKKYNPDIIILTMYNSKLTFVGVNWAIRNNKEYYLGPHEIINPYIDLGFKRYLKIQYYKWIVRKCNGVATMGSQSVVEISRIFEGNVMSIPYTFDLRKLLEMHTMEINHDSAIIFIYSGRLYDFRNPLLSIRAFHKIVENNPHRYIKLIISGLGPLESECISLISQLKLDKLVTWKNDFKDWYDIHNLYGQGHVLLALQNYGTWGLIIQEAMAAGLGIISTYTIQSAINNIVNGYNGFLVTKNENQIVNCMQKYIDAPHLISTHGKRSKEMIKMLDLELVVDKYIGLLRL